MIALTKVAKPAEFIDPDAEIIRAAKAGDQDARNQLVVAEQERIRRIAAKTHRQYHWIDSDDVAQHLSIFVMGCIDKFDQRPGVTWSKYIYHRMIGAVKDWLRAQDPLGIKWPQRKHYPNFVFGSQLDGSEDSTNTNSGWVRTAVMPDVSEAEIATLVEQTIELEPRIIEPDALRLAVLHGLTVAEIVEQVGCWITVQESLSVGLRRLRKLWLAAERVTPIQRPEPEQKIGGDMRSAVAAALAKRRMQ